MPFSTVECSARSDRNICRWGNGNPCIAIRGLGWDRGGCCACECAALRGDADDFAVEIGGGLEITAGGVEPAVVGEELVEIESEGHFDRDTCVAGLQVVCLAGYGEAEADTGGDGETGGEECLVAHVERGGGDGVTVGYGFAGVGLEGCVTFAGHAVGGWSWNRGYESGWDGCWTGTAALCVDVFELLFEEVVVDGVLRGLHHSETANVTCMAQFFSGHRFYIGDICKVEHNVIAILLCLGIFNAGLVESSPHITTKCCRVAVIKSLACAVRSDRVEPIFQGS